MPISTIFILNRRDFSFLRGDGVKVWHIQVNVRDRLPKMPHVMATLSLI